MERDDGIHTRLSAGARVTYDGQAWEVAELAPPSVLLAGAAGELRRVSISHLLAVPGTRIGDGSGAEREPLRGAGAGQPGQRRAGATTGSGGSRAGGVHRLPQRQPGSCPARVSRGRSTRRAPASSSGIRPRQPRCRWECGPWSAGRPAWSGTARPGWWISGTCAGGHRKAGPTPGGWRWPARCWPSTLTRSTPTQDLILDRIAARLDAGHGTGAVPLPGQTRARAAAGARQGHQRVRRSQGQARSPALARRRARARPLRAARPGEYLLLDTTRLDVFMDPVTLRWVQCELTVAMDLYDRCITGLRLTPVSTKAVDAAAVLFESVRRCRCRRRAGGWPPCLLTGGRAGDRRRRQAGRQTAGRCCRRWRRRAWSSITARSTCRST